MVTFRRGALACAWLLMSVPAWAQGTGWEVEVHGGGAFVNNLGGGSGSVPPPGQAFTTFLDLPSRQVSSWYFGDGTTLMNDTLAGIGQPQRITSLDSVLTSRIGERGNGGSFGFRVARAITPRFGAEFSLDFASTPVSMTDAAVAGLEASSATFVPAIRDGYFFDFPPPESSASSSVQTPGKDGSQVSATGALTINLATQGSVIPYATVGAGIVSNRGDMPMGGVDGTYTLDILNAGILVLTENDSVRVAYATDDSVFVAVFGGGVKAMLSSRSGIRADVRVHAGSHTVQTLLSATPSHRLEPDPMLQFALLWPVSPTVQVSNVSDPAFPTSLSGPAQSQVETFSADGVFSQVLVSVGYFWRF